MTVTADDDGDKAEIDASTGENDGSANKGDGSAKDNDSAKASNAAWSMSESDSLEGAILADRYELKEKLGVGGMGSVYLAQHITLEKLVAIKVLHTEYARKPDLVQRFLQEAKAASRIRHPHVIDITHFGQTDEGIVYFAMEYLEGQDLSKSLRPGPLSWDRTKDIFMQLCDALAAAHEKDIIHRDLKPDNVFLVHQSGNDDFVKLLDFGIAKLTDTAVDGPKLTRTGALFGTPEYMSPEQAVGGAVDLRTDIYAMGCILFQMITGKVPFQSENFMATLNMHLVMDVPEVDEELAKIGGPAGIADVLRKAMAKDPEDRYSCVCDLYDAMEDSSGTYIPKKRTTRPGSHSRPRNVSRTLPSSTMTPTRLERPDNNSDTQDTASAILVDEKQDIGSSNGKLLIVAGIAIVGGLALLLPKLLSSDAEPATTTSATVEPAVTPTPVIPDARPAPTEQQADQIRITSSPPGATIEYMGNRYTAPITIAIEPGNSRTIVVRKSGYQTSTLVVAKGQKIAQVALLAVAVPDAGSPKRRPTPVVKDKRPPIKTVPTIPSMKPPATSTDNPNPWAQ